jgi:TPR repeat protein
MYRDGLGVTKSLPDAVKWFRAAAEQGYPLAEAALGARYAAGQGVAKDHVQALAWTLRAESHGLARAAAQVRALTAQMSLNEIARARALAAAPKP